MAFDIVDRKDILRTMYLASSIMLIFSAFYAVYLHSQYTGKINQIRLDLMMISQISDDKADKLNGTEALKYRQVAREARELAKEIAGPKLNPYAYAYLNYWISSAAFTELLLSYSDLGLDNSTISALQELEDKGWMSNSGRSVLKKPNINAYPWTYYIMVLLVSGIGAWFGVKKEYETKVVPEIISAALSLVPFWTVVIVGAVLGILFGVLKSEIVSFGAYFVSLIVTIILSALSGAIVGIIKERREKI